MDKIRFADFLSDSGCFFGVDSFRFAVLAVNDVLRKCNCCNPSNVLDSGHGPQIKLIELVLSEVFNKDVIKAKEH